MTKKRMVRDTDEPAPADLVLLNRWIRPRSRFYRAEGMQRNAAISLRGLALGELRSGRPQQAIEQAQAALGSFCNLGGAELDAVITLNNLAEAQQAAGLTEAAESSSRQAVSEARTCGSSFEEARALLRLGELSEAADPEAATAHWSAALELYTRLHAPEAKHVRERLERIG
jgi:tetratricopeptide (TPR) repeat protein